MSKPMYLALKKPCPRGEYFFVPHRSQPITAKRIMIKYPKFAEIFDGESIENTLTFYYKKDKESGIYEFIDLEAEEEVAELMGVKIKEFVQKDEETLDADETIALNPEQISNFRNNISDIRNGIDWLNNDSNFSSSDSSDSDSSDSDSDSSDSSDTDYD